MEILLNDNQRRIVDLGVDHLLRGSLEPFEISGPPGTGKSVVLNEIKRLTGKSPHRIAPMSYIGQAAIIMRLKGFQNAKTFHSWLYRVETNFKVDKKSNKVIYNEHFGTKDHTLEFVPKPMEDIDYVFVDEGGTTPIKLRKDLEKHGLPTIVAGDVNQLPPVGGEAAYLTDPSKIHYLTEIMRQKKDSGILYIADRALKGLPVHRGYYGDAMVIYDDEVDNSMLRDADMVICNTNATRQRLNQIIREDIYGYKGTLPNYGEKVICRKNNWHLEVNGIGLANGLIGTVASPPDISLFDGTEFLIDFKPDLFDGVFCNLNLNYKFFNAPFSEKNKIKMDKFQTGEMFDYAYCITTHLSQGGEYPNVIYFEEYMPEIYNKLNFTAATRAKYRLIYVKKKRQFFMS